MKLIKRALRTIRRIDRATGKIRDRAIRTAVVLIRAYRKRNGAKVRAHKRVIGGPRGNHAVKRRSSGTQANSNRQPRQSAAKRAAR